MPRITNIFAYEILDSRGNPTIACELTLDNNFTGIAKVPSGASTGAKEALELRDNDKSRYLGKGVLKALANVNKTIKHELVNNDFAGISALDNTLIELDGTDNKSKLGANAILAVSMAAACAFAKYENKELYQYLQTQNNISLPTPMLNILNGGAHADNNVDIQEFMIVPTGNDFVVNLQKSVEVYHALKAILKAKNYATMVGDEGGFAPNLTSNKEALDLILEAIEHAGFKAGNDFTLAMDVAANEILNNNSYTLQSENKSLSNTQFADYLITLANDYPISSIEDGLSEDDFEGWAYLTTKLGKKIQLVGDDLFVTNSKLLQKGIDDNIANAILIKLNQIGTVSETIDTIKLAKAHNYHTVISHRSGETDDAFIADLAVATDAKQIKTGAPARTDRVVKYNRLLRIAANLI